MKYRSNSEILGSILKAATGGASKTKIMNEAFLSLSRLRDYLFTLQEKGLVEYQEDRQSFRSTEKGIKLLQIYNYLNEGLLISNDRLGNNL